MREDFGSLDNTLSSSGEGQRSKDFLGMLTAQPMYDIVLSGNYGKVFMLIIPLSVLDVAHLKEDHNFKTPKRSSGQDIQRKRRLVFLAVNGAAAANYLYLQVPLSRPLFRSFVAGRPSSVQAILVVLTCYNTLKLYPHWAMFEISFSGSLDTNHSSDSLL